MRMRTVLRYGMLPLARFLDRFTRDPLLRGILSIQAGDHAMAHARAPAALHAPLLGNAYLHYALDRWFERRVKPRLRGQATLVRYADDFVIGFETKDDAKRVGRWGMTCKTRSASLRRFIGSVYDGCRRHRHLPVAAQHKALKRRIQGHFNYFGVSGNFISLLRIIEQVKRAWYKWLCRRSQRKRLTWERFADLLRDFPLPKPRIMVRIWGS